MIREVLKLNPESGRRTAVLRMIILKLKSDRADYVKIYKDSAFRKHLLSESHSKTLTNSFGSVSVSLCVFQTFWKL